MIDKSYLYLISAIIFGYTGNILIKESQGFTKTIPIIFACITFLACVYFMAMSLKTIPFGINYITYSSSVIILTTLSGIFIYNDKYNFHTILGSILVLLGIAIIHLYKK